MRSVLDPDAHLLVLTLEIGETAQSALEQSLTLVGKRPELWSWDWVVEAAQVPADATVGQIDQLARIYVQPDSPATTVLVSEDRFLHLWARVMDFQFPRRAHRVLRSLCEARRFIQSEREHREGGAKRLAGAG